MTKHVRNKQKIYDIWHKQAYQLDLKKDVENFSYLHSQIFKYLHITDKTQGRLLDIACGKGLLLKAVREINTQMSLFGTDISNYAVKSAKKIVKDAQFNVGDGENISFKSNHFDYITCLGGLEYYDNPIAGVEEMRRLLEDNGVAIIFVPNLMFIGYVWLALRYGSMPTHGGLDTEGKEIYDYSLEKFYTHQGWLDAIMKGGLKIISSYRFDYIGSTRHVNPLLLKMYNSFFYKIVPFNLAYSFVFICKKK